MSTIETISTNSLPLTVSAIECHCVTSDSTLYKKSVILDDSKYCDFNCVRCLGTGYLRPIVKTDFPLKEGSKWGVIKWYSTVKQYGFIWLYGLVNSTPDVFFHYSDIEDEDMKANPFKPGDFVNFDMVIGDNNKLYGANVRYYKEGE